MWNLSLIPRSDFKNNCYLQVCMIFNRFALDTEVRFQPFSGFNMMIVHKSNHMNITPTVYKMPKEQAFENKDVMGEYFAENY